MLHGNWALRDFGFWMVKESVMAHQMYTGEGGGIF